MIIGIDGNEANVAQKVGIGRYAFEVLWSTWRIRNGKKSTLKFKIYLKGKPEPRLPRETDWWQYIVCGPKPFWTQIGLPLALFKDFYFKNLKLAVFFSPTHYGPRFCPCPKVVSIMDLSFIHFPRMFKTKDLYQLKNWTAQSLNSAQKVLTISQKSKDDIINYYQLPPEKVVVTYPGMSTIETMLSNDELKKKYGTGKDYILSVGTLQPRKNFGKLIEAFKILVAKYPNLSLLIVGKKGWLYQDILDFPKKLDLEDRIKFLEFVPDSDLKALYQHAQCFVLVSLYEGFGLPALEAMAESCPVVVSNVSSLPEVVGEAGILVEPEDSVKIAQAITKILALSPSDRKLMIDKGLAQASKFSWEKCARQTLEVIEQLGESQAKGGTHV